MKKQDCPAEGDEVECLQTKGATVGHCSDPDNPQAPPMYFVSFTLEGGLESPIFTMPLEGAKSLIETLEQSIRDAAAQG